MPNIVSENNCPTCGSARGADALGGLCLKCLGRLGFGAEAATAAEPVLLRLGDYELLGEIARGGMGVVYRARQLSLNRIVALKVVLQGPFSSADFIRRFRTEATAAASLRHPNIVPIYEVGEHGGHHFLAMEYIDGQNLAEVIREKPLPARRAAIYVKAIAEAVEHAHGQGILHRDLKPSNVLLDAFDQPRVTDFGLAKVAHNGAEITITGQVLGSPSHMPPEQAAGKFSTATARSDVYSLGAILYHLVSGRPPFQGETIPEVLLQVQTAEPVAPRRLNPSIPADLQTICLKCLQKDPGRRYESAGELAADLERFLGSKPIQARPVSIIERAWLWCRRRPVVAAMTLALVLAVAVGFAGILWQWRRAEVFAKGELRQRIAAEESAAKMRLNLYAADVGLAAQEIESDDFGLARHRLDGLRPKPGEPDLRGFEWRYLWNLCRGAELATLTGHEWIVTCVGFAPDGTKLASGSIDGSVRIWDLARRQSIATLRMSTGAVMRTAFTPDGKALMIGGVSGVELRSVDSWQILTNFPARLASLSREGTLMATSDSSPFYYEHDGEVSLWNWRTGERLRRFKNTGHSLALSPDGHRLAVARVGTGADLYDADTGKLLRVLPTPKPVWWLNFSPDGRQLLTTGWSTNFYLWHTEGDIAPRVIAGHNLTVWSGVFSPDGTRIATTGSDQTIHLWDAGTLQQLGTLRGHGSEVWCAAFSPDGRTLATGSKDCHVLLWSTEMQAASEPMPSHKFQKPFFSADGTTIRTIQPGTDHNAQLWTVSNRAQLSASFADGSAVPGFCAKGKSVVVIKPEAAELQFWTLDGKDTGRRASLQSGFGENGPPIATGLCPDGAYFFAADKKGTIRVWEVESGRLQRTVEGPMPPLRNIVLGPGGRHLAVSVERENGAWLYDCATGRGHNLQDHRDFVSGLAFSPDDRLLATGSMDGTIRIWKTASGELASSLPGHMQETTDVAFSPDGQTLASIAHQESLKLWHLPTLREVYSAPLLHAGVSLQFSPDGRRLAYGTDDQTLCFLEAPLD